MKKYNHLYHPEIIRAVGDDNGILEGYASVFNVIDWYGTKTQRGTFKKTISEKMPIPMLWNHNPDNVIGQIFEAREDSKGLFVRAKLNLDIQQAKDVYSNYKKGIIRGFSIGGWVIKTENDDDGSEIIKELALDEISAVTFPANEEALVEMVRSRTNKINIKENVRNKLIQSIVDIIHTQLNKYKTEEEIEKEIIEQLNFELMSLRIKRAETREEATNLLVEFMSGMNITGGADILTTDTEADEIKTSPSDEPVIDHSEEIEYMEILNLLKGDKNVRKFDKTD